MKRKVIIYQDKGVSRSSALGWKKAFDDRGYHTIVCDKKDLLKWIRRKDIAAVIMPGGNSGDTSLGDNTIKASLGNDGAEAIRDYAQNGVVLAVCGSAYRLSHTILFKWHRNGGEDYLKEKGANLVNVVTRNWKEYDDSPKTAITTKVTFNGRVLNIFYHGGPTFDFAQTEDVTPFLYFDDGEIAGAEVKRGNGAIILLSPHPEHAGVMPNYADHQGSSKEMQEYLNLVRKIKQCEDDHNVLLDHLVERIENINERKAKRVLEKHAALG